MRDTLPIPLLFFVIIIQPIPFLIPLSHHPATIPFSSPCIPNIPCSGSDDITIVLTTIATATATAFTTTAAVTTAIAVTTHPFD